MKWTALHRLLGVQPGPITSEMINAAIEQELAEAGDLDFKSRLPPASGLVGTDYPKDIAAMANSGGGIIVYGVEEESKVATGRRDVGAVSESHERTLRSVAVSAITPPVFGLGVHRIGQEGDRVLIIVVPSSSDGPHLIYRNELFGAPIRNDADTVWMREPQIELMYRRRFDERRYAAEAINSMYAELAAGRDSHLRAWTVMVAHPRRPAARTRNVDRSDAAALFLSAIALGREYASKGVRPLEATNHLNPRPGLRRWVAPNSQTGPASQWREAWAAVHQDGSVSMASAIGGHRNGSGTHWSGEEIESVSVEAAVADFMGLVRSAADVHAIDEYEVKVGIEWGGSEPLLIYTHDNSGQPYSGVSTPLASYTAVESTVIALSSETDFRDQVVRLGEDCVNQGGITHLQSIRTVW